MMFVTFGVGAGVLWGLLRYPFVPLLPASALLATGAVLTGIALGTHPGVTALEVFGTIAAPQLVFVAVSLTHYRVRSTRLIPHVQAAIGKELRTELEVPRSVPPKLAVLVARLDHPRFLRPRLGQQKS